MLWLQYQITTNRGAVTTRIRCRTALGAASPRSRDRLLLKVERKRLFQASSLVCESICAAVMKYHRLAALTDNRNVFLTVPEAGKAPHQGAQRLGLVGACCLVGCWPSSHMVEGSRDLFWGGPFYKGTNPIHEGFASEPRVLGFQHELWRVCKRSVHDASFVEVC